MKKDNSNLATLGVLGGGLLLAMMITLTVPCYCVLRFFTPMKQAVGENGCDVGDS